MHTLFNVLLKFFMALLAVAFLILMTASPKIPANASLQQAGYDLFVIAFCGLGATGMIGLIGIGRIIFKRKKQVLQPPLN